MSVKFKAFAIGIIALLFIFSTIYTLKRPQVEGISGSKKISDKSIN